MYFCMLMLDARQAVKLTETCDHPSTQSQGS